MKCPVCGYPESKVNDSRPVDEGNSIRRRRECLSCGKRFTTFEMLEALQIMVVKRNGSKELFDRTKLMAGILKATRKRPVEAEQIANEIESELQNALRQEVTSIEIGDLVLEKLRVMDQVAYIRFASVYREFSDVDTFLEALKDLKRTNRKKKKVESEDNP